MFTCSKTYSNLPAAHRQPEHDGHCALIHGHNWGFKITFRCQTLDHLGFVVDFGKLKFIKTWLEDKFDHTLLLNQNDPLLQELLIDLGDIAKIVVVENCGAEKLAEYVAKEVNKLLSVNLPQSFSYEGQGLRVAQVVCFEDSKNEATYVCTGGGHGA